MASISFFVPSSWLHTTQPAMEQAEIATRVGITQSTVSKAGVAPFLKGLKRGSLSQWRFIKNDEKREEEIRKARQQEEALWTSFEAVFPPNEYKRIDDSTCGSRI